MGEGGGAIHPTRPSCARRSRASATGAATAGARAGTTPAASASSTTGSRCRRATTTSTSIATSATTWKPTDIQAAIGRVQLRRVDDFARRAKRNKSMLMERLAPVRDQFRMPEATPKSDPSWFGFLMCMNRAGSRPIDPDLPLPRRAQDRPSPALRRQSPPARPQEHRAPRRR